MTKKDEINKNNIIIGIATFAIIAIAIIAAFNFFTPKSHAQVQDDKFDKVAMSTLNKSDFNSMKAFVKEGSFEKVYREKKESFKGAFFASSFDKFDVKDKNEGWDAVFTVDDKTSSTFAFAKAHDWKQFEWDQSYDKDFKFAGNFQVEKWSRS